MTFHSSSGAYLKVLDGALRPAVPVTHAADDSAVVLLQVEHKTHVNVETAGEDASAQLVSRPLTAACQCRVC